MVNDTTTLDGSLQELGETLAANLTSKGVSSSASEGLSTLAAKILTIPSGGGGDCTRMVTGTFTTGSTRATAESVTVNYSGNGYPIAVMVYIDGGAYNNTSGGNTTWYASVNRYDVGTFYATKSEMNTTPTYVSSGSVTANGAVVAIIYKNSTSDSTSYTRTSNMTAKMYNSSNASTSYNCIRFKGNGKTLSWYVGNKASNNIGLAPSTKYAYIIVYTE